MLKQALAIAVLLCTAAGGVQAKEVKTRNIPVTQTVSPELQKLIGAKDPGWWNTHPKTTKEWKKWVAGLAARPRPSFRLCAKSSASHPRKAPWPA